MDIMDCPDGGVRCCLCFECVPLDELNILPSGKREDVCKPCAKAEATSLGICSNCGAYGPVGRDCQYERCAQRGGSYQ